MKIPSDNFLEIASDNRMPIICLDILDSYFLYASQGNISLECQIIKGTDEATDFEENHLANCNKSIADTENTPYVRVKLHNNSNNYLNKNIDFTTSTLGSLNACMYDGTNCGITAAQFYDADGVELTTQETIDSSCVCTVVDFQPPMSYEIISGHVSIANEVNDDYRGFIRIAPGLVDRDCIVNLNLRSMAAKTKVGFDAKVAELLPYYPGTTSNLIRIKITHPAGGKLMVFVSMELYI